MAGIGDRVIAGEGNFQEIWEKDKAKEVYEQTQAAGSERWGVAWLMVNDVVSNSAFASFVPRQAGEPDIRVKAALVSAAFAVMENFDLQSR